MIHIKPGIEIFNQATKEITNPPRGIKVDEWKKFSDFTGGLRMYEFTIFCGATGAGKTQFLANLMVHLTRQGVKVFCAPVETGPTDVARRMISAVSGIDVNDGDPHEFNRFKPAISNNLEMMSNTFFSTYDNRVDVQEMVQNLKYLNEKEGVQVAILDNLNFFLKPTNSADMILEMDTAVHEFVMLAKKIPIHIFLVMHPRKTEQGKLTSEFDIKGSSTAVQEASNILIMNKLNADEFEFTTTASGKRIPDSSGLNPWTREFVFKKIRKRGKHVNQKFYMNFDSGRYYELNR